MKKGKNIKISPAGYISLETLTTMEWHSPNLCRERVSLMKALIDSLPDIIHIKDMRGVYTTSNKAHGAWLGMNPDEILGKSDFDLFPSDVATSLCGRDGEILKEGRIIISEETITYPDGRIAWLETNRVPVRGADGVPCALLFIGHDITERKNAENALRAQLEFQQTLFDTFPYPVFYMDTEARLRGVNRAFERAFGVEREEQIGKRVVDLDFLPDEDRIAYQAEDVALIARLGSAHRERAVPFADGLIHENIYHAQAFRKADGSPGGLIGVFVDVTDHKKMEQTERFNRLALGREMRIVDLKRDINRLAGQAGRDPVFESPEQAEDVLRGKAPVPIVAAVMDEETIKREIIGLLRENEARELFLDFCKVLGVSASIIDVEGHVLVDSPKHRVCAEFHLANPSSRTRCIEINAGLAHDLQKGKDYVIYHCKNGMTHCVSPIIVSGLHVVSVFSGQFHTAEPDDVFFSAQADKFGFDRKEYLAAVHEATIIDEVRLSFILGCLTKFAKLVGAFAVERWRERRANQQSRNRAAQLRQDQLAAISLAEDAKLAHDEVLAVQDVTILALASLAETRDSDTGNHLRRTQSYVRALAQKLRNHPRFATELDEAHIALLFKSAPLHDIGKVGIPDSILLKPGRLEPHEFEIMKTHTILGRKTIENAENELGRQVDFLSCAKKIAYCHHEKFDGSGYPEGLGGDKIPLCARLMAVADVYDALVSRRVYKEGMPHEEAARIVVEGKGSHFDPDIVEAFVQSREEFLSIASAYAD